MSSNTAASRLATRLAFWVSGVAASAWAPMVPFVKQRLQIDEASLGLLLLCLGIGSVTAMVRTGPWCARYGCKPIVLLGGLCMALMLPVLAVADSVLGMGAALLVFGGALGSLDVAMNIHAIEVERAAERPMMSGFHAFFSVGGFSGAALVTALLSQTFTLFSAAVVCSALLVMALVSDGATLAKYRCSSSVKKLERHHGFASGARGDSVGAGRRCLFGRRRLARLERPADDRDESEHA